MFKFSVFRREPQWKILTQAKFSLRRKYRRMSLRGFTPPVQKNMTMTGPRHIKGILGSALLWVHGPELLLATPRHRQLTNAGSHFSFWNFLVTIL